MGLVEGVDDLLEKMGMSCLKDMTFPVYESETRDFLSTVKVTYENPKEKVASEGLMTFKIKNKGYGLTIANICEVYGFRNGQAVQFDSFTRANVFWNTIADGDYRSNSAKMTHIRSPVVRYVCKLLANTFFARKDTGKVTTKELCLIYQGLKQLLTEFRGDIFEYDFGDDINYGSIFANELEGYKKWVQRTDIPHVYVGSMITPLLLKAGVDFTNLKAKDDGGFEYINKEYLVASWFLKATKEPNLFLYRIQLRNKEKRLVKLPRKDLANIDTLENVKFDLGEVDLLDEDHIHEMPGTGSSEAGGSRTEARGSRDYMTQLNALELPEINFAPRTNREKVIHQAYKAQRAINRLQKKLFAKIFRKLKKIQPPTYVSSEEDEQEEEPHDQEEPHIQEEEHEENE